MASPWGWTGGHSKLFSIEMSAIRGMLWLQGRLRCLGSSSHLKLRFGGGYLLEVHAADDEGVQARLAAFIARELGGEPSEDRHFGRAKFRLPVRGQVIPFAPQPCRHSAVSTFIHGFCGGSQSTPSFAWRFLWQSKVYCPKTILQRVRSDREEFRHHSGSGRGNWTVLHYSFNEKEHASHVLSSLNREGADTLKPQC